MSDEAASLFNDGLIVLNPPSEQSATRTIVVSGVARSGTSMVAHALAEAGVHMGSNLDSIVFEDTEIADAIIGGDAKALARIVARRNRHHETWGFKRPHLFSHAGAELERSFRNPCFILTYRDPVAIARRNRIAEHFAEKSSLQAAVADLRHCVEFALGLTCPALLVSYEKALQQPACLVERLVSFCGLAATAEVRKRMEASIQASPAGYAQSARRRFEGYVDAVRGGVVHGWCRQHGDDAPVLLDITIGPATSVCVLADDFRVDLAELGFGTGHHAFHLDISAYAHFGNEVVTVRVHDRLFELQGSGRSVAELAV